MFTKAILAVLATASSTFAFPATISQRASNDSFTLISIHSGSAIQNSGITASGHALWIGKPTATYCPSSVGDACPAGNITAFIFNQPATTVSLSAAVPGGQQVYVTSDGVIGYTVEHSATIPDGAQTQGFAYSAGTGGSVGSLTWQDVGFTACPVEGDAGAYQVFATTSDSTLDFSGCTSIDLGAAAYEGETAAWEYE